MQEFRLIALTPPGLADAAIAIAASRAGEIGVLDLQYAHSVPASLTAIAKLAQYAKHECGIKIDGSAEKSLTGILSELPSQIKTVILTPSDPASLYGQVQTYRNLNLTVLLETTSLDEAQLGEKLGVSGLIAKGHEAAGRVGQETTFILLQHLLANTTLPVWAQGGIGLHTVAACYEAGAAGAVLDAQLTLTRESSLSEEAKTRIARMDGSETICLGANCGEAYRMYHRPGLTAVEDLRLLADKVNGISAFDTEMLAAWREEIKSRVGWSDTEHNIWLIGQDGAFAAPLAERFLTVGGVLEGMRQAVKTHGKSAVNATFGLGGQPHPIATAPRKEWPTRARGWPTCWRSPSTSSA